MIGAGVTECVVVATEVMARAVVADAAGNIYIGDAGNGRFRAVKADGTISTVAG